MYMHLHGDKKRENGTKRIFFYMYVLCVTYYIYILYPVVQRVQRTNTEG